MKKGITPIIAIIILLLITIALAGAAWTYLQGFLFSQISKSFVVPSGGAFCEGGIIKVYLLNTGYQSTLIPSDFILAEIGAINVKNDLVTDFSLEPGNASLVLETDCNSAAGTGAATKCSSGYHTLRLGTTSTIVDPRVSCA
jgi:flagellin-like protein